MRALALSAFISLSTAALAMARQGPGEGQFTIPVDVDLVVFNVTITDDRGRYVSGLKASDFQIHEDDQFQTITLFDPDDVPATVGLIIDNSGSMRSKHAEVASAALEFADASNSEDEMFIVNFNEKSYMGLPASVPFTNNLNLIRSALFRTPPAGLTALYDAVAVGIEHVKTGKHDRKALVVLSDGGDNASLHPLDDVLRAAQQSSATIYTIGIYDETDADRNPRVLRRIAELTGGRAYFPDTLRDLDQVWRDIAGGIRSQYTIGYHSTNVTRDGTFRKVKVTATRNGRQDLRVTTREGYVAPDDKPIAR